MIYLCSQTKMNLPMKKNSKNPPEDRAVSEKREQDDLGEQGERPRRQRVVVMKPRRYRRSTPVGRLRRNAQKVLKHAGFIRRRVASWGADASELALVHERAKLVSEMAADMDGALGELEARGYEPPPRPSSPEYAPGDQVAVAVKHLDRYREALAGLMKDDPDMLEWLVVDRVLPSGELVLRRGKRVVLPMVPRSHVEPRDPGEGGEE